MTAIDEIKARLDIVDLVSPFVSLRKSGRSYLGRCPFHEDRTPSFVVYPDTWSFHCFGCGANGSGFDFIMRQEGLSFSEALRKLAARAGVTLPERSADPVAKERRSRLESLVEAAAAYFRDRLAAPTGAAARAYLAERGIERETIDEFGLGYAPGGGDSLLRYLRGLGYSSQEIVTAGLAVERDDGQRLADRFRNRLIIPIRSREGKTIAFGARAIAPHDQPKYLNSPETPLFSKGSTLFALDRAAQAIRRADQAVIVEGYFDAISAHQAGERNVVAQLGTALTERQVRQVLQLTKRIVLALDADAAGREATLRGLTVVQAAAGEVVTPVVDWRGVVRFSALSDIDLRIAALPAGMDPDDLFRHEPARWRALVAEAKPVLEHLFAAVLDGADLSTPEAAARAARLLLPAIRQVPDAVVRARYLQRLARHLGVDPRVLLAQQAPPPRPTLRSASAPPPLKLAPERTLEHYALALLMRFPSLDPAAAGLTAELFEGLLERQLFVNQTADDETVGELKVRLATFPLHGITEANADQALREVARRLRDRYHRRTILGAAAADNLDYLAMAGDETGRLLAVWKARELKEER
ncbi:MAG: DNA primase [Chloroflexota bacterium]|nr:DNA primase [Dehalococcoidia bacterium]MDW8255193.1 DNA primase [Chloroflexota bacterium]